MLTLHYSSIFVLIIVLSRAVITVRIKDDLLPSANSTSTNPPLVFSNPPQGHVSSITPKSLVEDLGLFFTYYLTLATDALGITISGNVKPLEINTVQGYIHTHTHTHQSKRLRNRDSDNFWRMKLLLLSLPSSGHFRDIQRTSDHRRPSNGWVIFIFFSP
jgi:hypothetical protein